MMDFLTYPQLSLEAAIVLVAAIVGTVVLNLVPFINTPFRRFFTTIHELGHMFATSWSGGTIKGVQIYIFSRPDGLRGFAVREGGNPLWVIPAGYMSLTLFCTVLILLSGLPYAAPYVLTIVGGLLLLTSYIYGISWPTILLGVAFGAGMIWVSWYTELVWSVFLLNLIALQGSWTVLGDLRELIVSAKLAPDQKNDATDMAKVTKQPAVYWARRWYFLSILMLGAAFWFTWLRNLAG